MNKEAQQPERCNFCDHHGLFDAFHGREPDYKNNPNMPCLCFYCNGTGKQPQDKTTGADNFKRVLYSWLPWPPFTIEEHSKVIQAILTAHEAYANKKVRERVIDELEAISKPRLGEESIDYAWRLGLVERIRDRIKELEDGR